MINEDCLICNEHMKEVLGFPNGNRVYKCTTCGLRALRPLPSRHNLTRYYDREEYLTEDLAELHNDLIYGYDENSEIIKLYKFHLCLISKFKSPPAKLLEFGCARGVLLDLARAKGYQVSGVEMSRYASQYAREKFGLDVETASLGEVTFKLESFDVIIAFDVIEHLSQPESLLKTAKGLLKPNGLLVIGTPSSSSMISYVAEMLALLTRNRYSYPAYRFYGRGVEHLHIFNPHNLTLLLNRYGLELLQINTYSMPLDNMCDLNFIYKNAIRFLSVWPYEFILMARKK